MKRILFAIALVGCGGKQKPADMSATQQHPAGMDEHDKLPPELVKFHDVLAPRWHAEKGPERTKNTCDAMADFKASADAVAKLAPPAGSDAAKWSAGTKELVDAVAGLETACGKPDDAAAFDPAFQRVHEGFHAVAEAAGDEHKEMGGEHEGGEHAH